MDWVAIIMAIIIFGPLAVALILIGVVIYRIFFKMNVDPEYAEREKETQAKEKGWIYPLFLLMLVLLLLYRLRLISVDFFAIISLPFLLAILYILVFRHRQEKTGIKFLDIFRHPGKNIGLLSFLVLLIILYIVFMAPLLILEYY